MPSSGSIRRSTTSAMEDVMANGVRSATVISSVKSTRSYDVRILVSVAIVVVGVFVALFALAVSVPVDPSQIGNMSVFP
jgi:hypothetical protein